MKILFLTRLYQPHVGGVEKHVEKLSRELIKKGHQVTIITEKFDSNLNAKETKDGVKIVRFSYPHKKLFGLVAIWLWLFKNRRLISNHDIIHCHDVFIWYLPFRFLYPHKKVFTTFHGWEQRYPIPKKNILLKELAVRLSTKTIAIGKYIKKYYGITTDIVSYGATEIPKKIASKKNEIVFVGRLEKDTGLPLFLESMKIIGNKKIKVLFCGDGSLREQCAKFGKVLGFVDPSKFLAKSKFCFASGYLSILEAMINKCIVFVAYDNELKKTYFHENPFTQWIFISNSPEEISKMLTSKNSKKINTILEKSYNWAKKQTWESLTIKYLQLWGFEDGSFNLHYTV